VHQKKITADMGEAFGRDVSPAKPAMSSMEMAAVAAYRGAVAKDGGARQRTVVMDAGEAGYQTAVAYPEAVLKDVLQTSTAFAAQPAAIFDAGEALFRTDFPDAWQAVLSPQESAVSIAPRGAFVRFVSEDKLIFR
jgi:hypothetical protein